MILYLHGFGSGPQSTKSRELGEFMAQRGLAHEFWCKQLQWGPFKAMTQIEQVIAACAVKPTLVGSSLGGYYATCLAERHGLKAIVVNPSVLSYITLESFIGPQTMYYGGATFEVTRAHIDELRALDTDRLAIPERYWLMAETGDEVLDYRQAAAKYAGARQTILPGGDHRFTRWGDYLDEVLVFAGLS